MTQRLEIKPASRASNPKKIGLKGPSGCGKTYSMLLLLAGLAGDGRIGVIDTENGGSQDYDQLVDFDVITLSLPATGNDYVAAMQAFLDAGNYTAIGIDSTSHSWDAVIETENTISNKDMNTWQQAKVKTGYLDFRKFLMAYPLDVVCTVRSEEHFAVVTNDKGGATKRKIGLKPIQEKTFDFDMNIVFDIEQGTNIASSNELGKNRTPLFSGERFIITKKTGELIREWRYGGSEWVEPMRRATHLAISREIKAQGTQKTWRSLMAIPEQRKLETFSENEAQELLALMKEKSKEAK